MKILKISITLAFMVMISSFAINQVGNSTSDSGYAIGDTATDFKLKNIDDSFISLSNYPKAKGFIVIFTCNHCPYSVAYEDRIIALDQQYKSKGYPVIAINPNNPKAYPEDSFYKMKERAASKQFTFRTCLMKIKPFIHSMELPKLRTYMYSKKRIMR